MKEMVRHLHGPFDGPLSPTEQTAALERAFEMYTDLHHMIESALAAPPAERLRRAVRIVNRCGTLDDLLAAAGVAPVKDRPKPAKRSGR